MRRFVSGWMVVAAMTAFASVAWAGNQEVAEEIAQDLRRSGQMQDYKIGVKYQDGTAWLIGSVASEEQLNTALNLVMQSPRVDRVVNNLSVSKSASDGEPASSQGASGPLSGSSRLPTGSAHDVAPEQPAGARTGEESPRLSAAERIQRAIESRIRGASPQPARQPEAPQGVNRADRVPASFEPVPAQPTLAAQPTAPQPTAQQPTAQQPTAPQPTAPQPTAPQPMAPQPTAPQPMAPQHQHHPRVAQRPVPVGYTQPNAAAMAPQGMVPGGPRPMYTATAAGGVAPARYDTPRLPNYAWPSYAPYPNYAALTYPKQYSPTAWPYIGPFYPYPQVPLGWRKVTLEWDNGWWMLDFKDR